MTVKQLILELLDCDLSKPVSIEYPTSSGHIIGNYSRYDSTDKFSISQYDYGIIVGVDYEDK